MPILCFLFLVSQPICFKQYSYLPGFGITWQYGYVKGYDGNGDGNSDLTFSDGEKDTSRVCFFSYNPKYAFKLKDSILKIGPQGEDTFWDIGLADNDLLPDIVTKGQDPDTSIMTFNIVIYESADSLHYPKKKAWRWYYPANTGNWNVPVYFTDLDNDGRNEILFSGGPGTIIYVFENVSDNLFEPVYCCSIVHMNPYGTGYFGFADFDGDGRTEFITPMMSGMQAGLPTFFVWECQGDDRYSLVRTDTFSLLTNSFDVVIGDDLDHDGKPEIVIGAHWALMSGGCTGCLSIFEASGDNVFERVFVDSIRGLPYHNRGYFTHSDAGDVDGDNQDELVWAVGCNWYVYEVTGNNQYERVYQGHRPENYHNSTNINVYDLNRNGFAEIVESGGNETHVFEISPVDIYYPENWEWLIGGTQDSILWHSYSVPGADSFALYLSLDSARTWNLIDHGIAGTDSAYHWVVPDTTAKFCCKIALYAVGSVPTWDTSGQFFSIFRSTDVKGTRHELSSTELRIVPNPSRDGFNFSVSGSNDVKGLRIYSVLGQLVRELKLVNGAAYWNGEHSQGQKCASGIYYVIMTLDRTVITRKLLRIK